MIDEYVVNHYLQENPEASLRDFVLDLKEKRRTDAEREAERRNNEIQYYKDHIIGHYFLVEFHQHSHTILGPVPEDIIYGNPKKFPCIDIYTDVRDHLSVVLENHVINPLWLENPYSLMCGAGPGTRCKEISKEEFENTKNLLEQTILSIPTKID